MEKEIYLTILFDYYGELLTIKQQEYFKSYYFDNLSLSEIAENLKLSRNAIHKQLKSIEEKLIFYEKQLKLIEKDKQLKEIINQTNDNQLKEQLLKLLEL